MRYSAAALSLVSPALALALPTLSLLGEVGNLFGGHSLINDLPSHSASYDGVPGSYNSGSSSADSNAPTQDSGTASNKQGSHGSAFTNEGVSYNGGFASYTSISSITSSASSSIPTSISLNSTSSTQVSPEQEQTCESPSIVGCETASDSPAAEVEADSAGVYDFVIVGGGTAGLVIANRLSQNSYASIAVIEAGDKVFDNKNVTDVTGYDLSWGTEIDWQYESTPQTHAGDKAQTLRAGKALGGTSTINGRE